MDHACADTDLMACKWSDCTHNATTVPLLMQHLSYHSYLAKLMNIGENVVKRNCLPKCKQVQEYNIPLEKFGYTCEWEHCSFNFYNIYEFITHMKMHVTNNVTKETKGHKIKCCWTGCNTKYSTQTKLAEHLRTHVKEKTIGCPTCYTLFSSKTKFCDHRRRQQSTFMQSYQCSQCLKLFPSERLLRDHVRSHINHYKCTMCDMTCAKPSLLAKHIRFKHVKEKPYECHECGKKFVARHNLNTHLKIHEDKNPMKCDKCNFSCRTRVGLDNHYVKKHKATGFCYECHCCKTKFKRGGYLTKHLTKLHNYHWPSGHSRFKYRKDLDGIYRLQTVRLESLEVTREVIKSESMPNNKVQETSRYLLNYDNGKAGYVLSISETNEQILKPAENENNVLIEVQDVDEKGNVVKSRLVESEIVNDLTINNEAVIVGGHVDETSDKSSSFNKSTDSDTSVLKINESGDRESFETSCKTKCEEDDCFNEETTILDYEMFKKEIDIKKGG
ncbi:hypothetical protein JTB14_025086 [Gonioctena quinquepunctata]|nr:hypothetical protein JTB14_025086 [Gonioctena quinquepunctata]